MPDSLRERVKKDFPWKPVPDMSPDGELCVETEELFFRGTPEEYLTAARALLAGERLSRDGMMQERRDAYKCTWPCNSNCPKYVECVSSVNGSIWMQERILGPCDSEKPAAGDSNEND